LIPALASIPALAGPGADRIVELEGQLRQNSRNIAKDLLRQWGAMWTFVKDDAAFPTNNEAESALRKAVLWRKGSFGINSEAGARFVERILTLAGTTHRRGIDLLGWLTEAIQAELDGVPPPALA
jgi:transposase